MTKQNIHILKASGRLSQFTQSIEQRAKELVSKITEKILLGPVDIIFYDSPEETIKEIGIGGYSPNAYTLLVYLNPEFANFNKTINEQTERILAHELYHCMRWKGPGYGTTLLEALISEGLADHFDMEINHQDPQFWDLALTKHQLQIIRKKAQKEYYNTNYNHTDWFFGSPEKNIPKYSGYALGFQLVNNYLKAHSDKKASGLYSVKAKDILMT